MTTDRQYAPCLLAAVCLLLAASCRPAPTAETNADAAGETVLIDFYADNCDACRKMEPTIERLVEQGYPIRRVNVDDQVDLADEYEIPATPCFVLLVDGREVERYLGVREYRQLEQLLTHYRVPTH